MFVYWNFASEGKQFKSSGELNLELGKQQLSVSACIYDDDELKILNKMLGARPSYITVIDTSGHKLILYNCLLTSIENKFTRNCIVSNLNISFKMVIKQEEEHKKYFFCSFSFSHIEALFPLESFQTKFPRENKGLLSIEKEFKQIELAEITPNLKVKIESVYSDIRQSDSLYHINISQFKRVSLCFSEPQEIECLIDTVKRIKEYFEFIYHMELQIKNIELGCDFTNATDELLYSIFNESNLAIYKNENFKFRGSYEEIINGMRGWMSIYDSFYTGIKIWLKQIYNPRVDSSDLILWNSQTIETLCEHKEDVFQLAKEIAHQQAKKNGHAPGLPNLCHYLLALCKKYNFWYDNEEKYLADAKNVRDKLTHNNPKKIVTERQTENTLRIVRNFAMRFICTLINLEHMSFFLTLTPPDNMNK